MGLQLVTLRLMEVHSLVKIQIIAYQNGATAEHDQSIVVVVANWVHVMAMLRVMFLQLLMVIVEVVQIVLLIAVHLPVYSTLLILHCALADSMD